MTRTTAFVLGLAVTGATALAQPAVVPHEAAAAEGAVTASAISGPTRFLSNDMLEGRAPSKQGEALAVAYLASTLELLGVEPAGPNGSWEQTFDIVGLTSHVPEQWSFETRGGRVSLKFWDDFIAATGRQTARVALDDAEIVFVGYGIASPEYQWDDFKGVDVRGKVLLMLNNDPDWDPALFGGTRRLYYGRWTYKYEEAARRGAAGAIIIHTTPSAGYGWPVVQTSWTGEQYELPNGGDPTIEVKAWTTEAATRRLLTAAGFDLHALVEKAHSREFRPIPLGIRTSLVVNSDITRAQTRNVMGMIRGRDAKLRDEVVVFSAHHDHLGVGRPDATGDRIYNGARDNATGVGMVLAVARAFAALPEPPRRSVLFLFVTGEESGLLGSHYFATHPTVPNDRLVADINFDAGNIFGRTHDVSEVGRGKSDLDEVLDAVARVQGRVVTDEAFPDYGAFYRSDQFSFAKVGVPSLYFSSGVDFIGRPPGWGRATADAWRDAHYHQPSDQVDATWNWDGMVEDARLGFLVGYEVAQADHRPQWRSGDEFAHARPAPGD
ncbi:MAG: M28 family peptidase [Acidobacteriota bacterium]